MRLHFHRDPRWQENGIFAFSQCRCGARRVRWVNRRMYGPVPAGWPPLRDRHGRQVADSGWVLPVTGTLP